MFNMNPTLLIDMYKATHDLMQPENVTMEVSYWTPRMSRVPQWDYVIHFGLQGFIKEFLIEYFNENFFIRNERYVLEDYERIMTNTLGAKAFKSDKIKALHRLGYLPIEIGALPEGTKVPMHIPIFYVRNTHPDFAWLPQALEPLLSSEIWCPQVMANVAYTYRQIVNKWYDKTVDNNIPRNRALSNFDMRGDTCLDNAVKTGAAWLTSFANTSTVPSIVYLERYYHANTDNEAVGYGLPSTEHSVMCANRAVDGDEITLLRRLLTEIYPDVSFSCVCDSYDYWNIVDNILPQLKSEIMAHNGFIGIRGDSGDPVDVVTKTVFHLWNIFGGTINSKGYKVLDPHIKAVYGDSITLIRCEEIYKILEQNGFAANNVSLGVGSFSMRCLEEDKIMNVILENGKEVKAKVRTIGGYTRDTFSSCIKATYCEVAGQPMPIFKNPKEGNFKKSQKGCCVVFSDHNGNLLYKDNYTWDEASNNSENLLKPIFRNGEMLQEQSLNDIRAQLYNGGF